MISAELAANRHLEPYGLKVGDLARLVEPPAADETLLLVGSVPEGLANRESDIDLLVIGRQTLDGGLVVEEENSANVTLREASGLDVNREVIRPEALEATAARFAPSFGALRDPEGAENIYLASDHELRLLHRLRTGLPLGNPDIAQRWRERLRLDELPDYVTLFALAHHLEYREDAIAQIPSDDDRTGAAMLRLSMDYLAQALLGSVGCTNQHPKWRVRLLERHREEIGPERAERCIESLFPVPGGDLRRMLEEAIAFSDELIGHILGRKPGLLRASAELNRRIQYKTSMDD